MRRAGRTLLALALVLLPGPARAVDPIPILHPSEVGVTLESDGSLPRSLLEATGIRIGGVSDARVLAGLAERWTVAGRLAFLAEAGAGEARLDWTATGPGGAETRITVTRPLPFGFDVGRPDPALLDALAEESAARFLALAGLAPPVAANAPDPVVADLGRGRVAVVAAPDGSLPAALLVATAGALGTPRAAVAALQEEIVLRLDGRLLRDGTLDWTVTEVPRAALGAVRVPLGRAPGARPLDEDEIRRLAGETAAGFRALRPVALRIAPGPLEARRPRARSHGLPPVLDLGPG